MRKKKGAFTSNKKRDTQYTMLIEESTRIDMRREARKGFFIYLVYICETSDGGGGGEAAASSWKIPICLVSAKVMCIYWQPARP